MHQETLGFLNRVCTDLKSVAAKVSIETDAVVGSQDHIEIIRHFDQTRKAVEQIKEAREALQELSDRLSREYVPDVMRANMIKTIKIDDIGRVTISNRFSATMLNPEMGMDWLRKNGHGGLIKETVNSQSLSAFAKELLETKNEELPPDIFKVGTSPFTSITKK